MPAVRPFEVRIQKRHMAMASLLVQQSPASGPRAALQEVEELPRTFVCEQLIAILRYEIPDAA